MKKSIVAIIMAVTLVGSSLAFPVQAYARQTGENVINGEEVEEIYQNEEIESNNGEIEINNGMVSYNMNSITTNGITGTIGENWGNVESNEGIVGANYSYGKVENNNGKVTQNVGKVTVNEETVGTNNGTVEINNGEVTENGGTVTTNNNKVVINYKESNIKTNSTTGTVETNNGTVETNNGTVATNGANGIVTANFGTVATNNGTVENNFGGTVVEGKGNVINQWYEYILNGGSYVSGSNRTVADGRNWVGGADESAWLTVTADEGMTFDYAIIDGEQVAYVTNEDGSISIENIKNAISIFFKQLTNNNNNSNDDENTGDTNESSADANDSVVSTNDANLVAAIESVVAAEEKMPVTSFTSDEAVAKIPATAKSAGASYNLSAITTSQGFIAAVNKISENVKAQNAANNNTARRTSVTIYSDKPMNFTADILNAISNSDIDFVFVFMHNGKMYRVTIPRGANVNLNGRMYEGPLFIGQILGTTEEIG